MRERMSICGVQLSRKSKVFLLAQGALLLGLIFSLGIAQPTSATLTAALPSFCGALQSPDDGLPGLPVPDLFALTNALAPALTERAANAPPSEQVGTLCDLWMRAARA
jgi:hypothetical protein